MSFWSRRRPLFARLGALVTAGLAVVAIPGVTGGLHRSGVAMGHHLLPVALGAIAVALLIVGYWDAVLRFVHIRTPASLNRLMRKWLETQHYAVFPRKESPKFLFDTQSSEDTIRFTIQLREQEPWGVQVSAALANDERSLSAAKKVDPRELQRLKVELTRVATSAGGDLSFELKDPSQADQFFHVAAVIPASLLQHQLFFLTLHAVRRCVVMALVLVQDSLAEHLEGSSPALPTGHLAGTDA
jgi:hypothetical protein